MDDKNINNTINQSGYPIIKQFIYAEDLEKYEDFVFSYCATHDEPVFIIKDGSLDLVMMSKDYYQKHLEPPTESSKATDVKE